MAQDHIRLQKMVAHNANEVQSYMKDINDWSSEMETKEEMEKNIDVALRHKESGNKFMKEKKYNDAVRCYGEGLKFDPKNAILYLNRAQAFLNLKKYQLTVDDCKMTLSLNPSVPNIKALYRRAKAYIELKQLDLAKDDLRNILKLDPKNTESKQLLGDLNNQLKPKTALKKCPEKQIMDYSSKEEVATETSDRKGGGDSEFPKIISPIDKPPHLQSKRVILPVPVRVRGEQNNSKRNSASLPSSAISSPVSSTTPTTDVTMRDENDLTRELDNLSTMEIPSKPTTAAQFMSTWKILKEQPGICAQYLNKLEPQDYEIFQDSMDLAVLSEILTLLQWEFLPRKWPFTHHLEGLLRVRRLGTLFMLMTEKDRAHARNLIFRCTSDELRSYYNTNFII